MRAAIAKVSPLSNIQAERAHEFDAIALGDDAGAQLEIELKCAMLEFLLEMNVLQRSCFERGNIREGQIVRADQADGIPAEQRAKDALRADLSVRGIGSLQ